MLAIFRNPAYDFIGWRHWAYGVSAALMLLGLGSILAKGDCDTTSTSQAGP